jgi:hypothetical protein
MQTSQQTNRTKFIQPASSRQRVRAGIIFLSVTALFTMLRLAAMGTFDIDRWLNPCGFRQQYNLPCPTCGMTTSAILFVKGKILDSFYTQPAAAFFCCVLFIAAFLAFLTAVFGVYFSPLNRLFAKVRIRYIILAILIIILAGWAVTLIQNGFQN